jgi:multisubunit Na+/H+ antiporter MnhB subunit
MYYIYSLCITLILFYIINIYEKKEFIKEKDILIIIILYLITTTIIYFLTNIKEEKIKILENIDTGFSMPKY